MPSTTSPPADSSRGTCDRLPYTDQLLGNAVWHALTGPQRSLAAARGSARRFRPDVAPFCALPDEPSRQAWRDLASLLRGADGILFRPPIALPEGWRPGGSWPCYQMTQPRPIPHHRLGGSRQGGHTLLELGDPDVADMMDLVTRTEPGPFLSQTIRTGRYVGIRIDGRLVAMAGERLRCGAATEISAVCVDPDFRGRGLAQLAVAAVAAGIHGRGGLPFLHVVQDNAPALELYRRLGFGVAREVAATLIGCPAANTR